MNRAIDSFTPEALAALAAHDWPGNVRQLENVVRRMVVIASGPRIGLEECKAVLGTAAPALQHSSSSVEPFHQARAEAVARFEKAYLGGLLQAAGHYVAEAARRAGIDRKNLWLKLKRYGIARAQS